MTGSEARPDLWLYQDAMPFWVERAQDRRHGGFFDRLSADGARYAEDAKTTLVQARMLFTCAHARLHGGGSECVDGAEAALAFLTDHLRDSSDGGFFRAVGRDGSRAAPAANLVKDAYDHSFVLLGLAAWLRLGASPAARALIDTTFDWLHGTLFDPATGGYHEDDRVTRPAEPYPLPRRQNPHMHLFEALLALYETTGEARWLDHARRILGVFEAYFFDAETGSLREFLDRDLGPAPPPAGLIREPGHQFEWVWLLHRYAALTGDHRFDDHATALYRFGWTHGTHRGGGFDGAVYDEIDPSGAPITTSMLLWPQTEGIKAHLARAESAGERDGVARARHLSAMLFRNYISPDRPIWRNQIDLDSRTLQPDAPTRLLYHVAMAVIEGQRLGA
ncbi:AGE family epimerase/isomerase [uncultured Paracoccus sp.]|uniref:AGE family epimerase/isomerase n=1 Tax=uncultured Paracoccus sp. TaxID=189685 RepID=UPI00262CAB9D|nr:AGE family epimerase/isomerase [uncultured Paracoccus sp.]